MPKAQHGAVFADGWFSGCAWSPDEQRVAYVAEAHAPAPAASFNSPVNASPDMRPCRSPWARKCRSGAAGAARRAAMASSPPCHGPGRAWATGRCATLYFEMFQGICHACEISMFQKVRAAGHSQHVVWKVRCMGLWHVQEDWGELYTGKRAPALFVLDLKTWALARVRGLPAESSAALPIWDPEGAM